VATRRDLLLGLGALSVLPLRARSVTTYRNLNVLYGPDTLPSGIRSRIVDNNNGVKMHILEAGFDSKRPCVVLLHGFPELGETNYCPHRRRRLPRDRA
jgi:hypothetical protein